MPYFDLVISKGYIVLPLVVVVAVVLDGLPSSTAKIENPRTVIIHNPRATFIFRACDESNIGAVFTSYSIRFNN